jgi:hypothetical protein
MSRRFCTFARVRVVLATGGLTAPPGIRPPDTLIMMPKFSVPFQLVGRQFVSNGPSEIKGLQRICQTDSLASKRIPNRCTTGLTHSFERFAATFWRAVILARALGHPTRFIRLARKWIDKIGFLIGREAVASAHIARSSTRKRCTIDWLTEYRGSKWVSLTAFSIGEIANFGN